MPLISLGRHIQEPLEDKEIATLLEEIVSKNVPLIIEHTKYTDKRLFSGKRTIEWYNIYYKIDECQFQCINLATDGNGISRSICLAYLYGYLNGLNHSAK